jgi:hypothetical protein
MGRNVNITIVIVRVAESEGGLIGAKLTQIIAAITQEYVLLAADRRLTYGNGPRAGEVYDDDTCKMVSLCGTTGIAYSGVGEMLGGVPTHEWIAKALAEDKCRDPKCAEETLIKQAPIGLSATPRKFQTHTFLFAGWAYFGPPPVLRPYMARVTNTIDATGKPSSEPLHSFNAFRISLKQEETLKCCTTGELIAKDRAEDLARNLRRLIAREIGPKDALRLMVDEIINSSRLHSSVGSKILGFCIPRKAVETVFEKGNNLMVAAQPNPNTTSFTYFEDGYSELKQYGPTSVCGEWALTDVETENDPSRDMQSASMRILAVPKPPQDSE